MTVSSREVTYAEGRLRTFKKQSTFADADSSIPHRLVGSYEYGNSIDYLTELAESSTEEELEVYDKLILQHPEYSFFSGIDTNKQAAPAISNAIAGLDANGQTNTNNNTARPETGPTSPAAGNSTADNQNNEDDENRFKRHSLAWMLALARIEVGATSAMYGNSGNPFGESGSTSYGLKEYARLMIDDAASSIRKLRADTGLAENLDKQEEVDSDTLAYLRRVKLVDEMLRALAKLNNAELNSRLAPYVDETQSYVKRLVEKVQRATAIEAGYQYEIGIGQTDTEEQIQGLRFQNRESLTGCQRSLESHFNNNSGSDSPDRSGDEINRSPGGG